MRILIKTYRVGIFSASNPERVTWYGFGFWSKTDAEDWASRMGMYRNVRVREEL